MYHRHFGLNEAPFSIAVNPRYLYLSARHRDALGHLLYGASGSGGFVLLSGEVGTGKTTIIRALLEKLPDTTDVALIINPAVSAEELLETVCEELNVAYVQDRQSIKTLTKSLHQFLLSNHAKGRNTVLLIDEAQHMKIDVLEQIRLLTNLETNTKKLLQIILVGQPEIRKLLNRQELSQLSQRITARYHLKPLDLEETKNYIRHRLQVAGLPATQTLFPNAIIKSIHTTSGGVPRIINVLCDHMLLGAYGQNKTEVDEGIFKQAVLEVFGEGNGKEKDKETKPTLDLAHITQGMSHKKPLLASIAAGLVLVIGTIIWQFLPNFSANQAIEEMTSEVANPTENLLTAPTIETTEIETDASARFARASEQVSGEPSELLSKQSSELLSKQTSGQLLPQQIDSQINEVQALAQLDSVWIADERAAVAQLLAFIDVEEYETSDCDLEATIRAVRCERINVESWQGLKEFNRPAVLTLITKAKMQRFVPLIGFSQNEAFVLDDGDLTRLSIVELGEQWSGEAALYWRADEQYKNPISLGNRGPFVDWLAQQFAIYDQQENVLAENQFNEALQQRVILFQRDNQLEDDGVVGIKTLLKLEEKLGNPITLLRSWPDERVSQKIETEPAPSAQIARQGLVNQQEADK